MSHLKQMAKRSYIRSVLTKVASEAMSVIVLVTQPQCDDMSPSAGASNLIPGTPQKSQDKMGPLMSVSNHKMLVMTSTATVGPMDGKTT